MVRDVRSHQVNNRQARKRYAKDARVAAKIEEATRANLETANMANEAAAVAPEWIEPEMN